MVYCEPDGKESTDKESGQSCHLFLLLPLGLLGDPQIVYKKGCFCNNTKIYCYMKHQLVVSLVLFSVVSSLSEERVSELQNFTCPVLGSVRVAKCPLLTKLRQQHMLNEKQDCCVFWLSEWVLRTPFAGWNQFCDAKITSTEQNNEKRKESRTKTCNKRATNTYLLTRRNTLSLKRIKNTCLLNVKPLESLCMPIVCYQPW